MSEGVMPDVGDTRTTRPKVPPISEKGDHFEPFPCPPFQRTINLPTTASASSPISLFKLYFTQEIMEGIIEYTNRNYKLKATTNSKPQSRLRGWKPISIPELYTYLAIIIYQGLHRENKLKDYWNTDKFTPDHIVRKYM